MAFSFWTDKDVEILTKYYPLEGYNCADRIEGKTRAAVKNKAYALGLKPPSRADLWQDWELDILRTHYPDEGSIGCHKRLTHRTRDAISKKAYFMKIGVSHNFKRQCQFQDGNKTHNKGRKYSHDEIHENIKKNWFKKGYSNSEYHPCKMPIGTLRHSKTEHWRIKVNDVVDGKSNWKRYHVWLWEKLHNKTLPQGHHIAVINGSLDNLQDLRPDNLQMVNNADRLTIEYSALPDELKKVINTLGHLTKVINQIEAKNVQD